MPRQQSTPSRSHTTVPAVRPNLPPPKIWYAGPTQPTLWDSMKQGIGIGAGSEIGHRIMGNLLGAPTSASLPPPPVHSAFVSEHYKPCLEFNKQKPQVCQPFLSKDKSPWTLCMEANFYNAEACSTETMKIEK